ncbi:TPA: hypothetical protein L5C29_003211 [Pseudomonas aeruginosa]|nr:hypothetical protein [Pseudomonas aeruginosa]EKX2969316.1 hypothetical protein [Pseudomonas aeruginosa]RUE86296.1 hypothetical protein IPC1135_29420 [Pseudomonas aeruginosa]HBO8004302.1 hypothetical protein [Pseudomonas aeruginosa]
MDSEAGWQARCGITKVQQTDGYGCGAACLAMVTGMTYAEAREHFVSIGLGVRRSCRPPLSTSSREMRMAVASSGLIVEARRWKGWDSFEGLGILKVRDDWRGAVGKWHWVVAFRHPEFDVVIFDPHAPDPAFRRMPADVTCWPFHLYEPKGEWLQVEQRLPLVRKVEPAGANRVAAEA